MTSRITSVAGYDFHCHVDLHKDPQAIISRCDRERVFTLAVTTTPKAYAKNKEWTRSSQYVVAAPGLHPEVAADRIHELPELLAAVRTSRFVGEIGLDGSPQYKASYGKQIEVFTETLKAAQAAGGRAITIHSRRAVKDVVELIGRYTTPDRVLCILHWYTGSHSGVRRATELGCYFSVNANMLNSEKTRSLIGNIPQDRLLTETDAPFSQTDWRASVPWDVVETAETLASLSGQSAPLELHKNAMRVLRFVGVTVDAEAT